MNRLLTCREVIDFLLDYVEDGLTAAQREAFEAHLAVCPACVDYVRNYRSTIHLGRAALAAPDAAGEAPDAPEELVAAILAARTGRS